VQAFSRPKITLALSPATLDYLVDVGDPVYGARPLKRAIQREFRNPLATKLLENTFTEGDTIMVDYIDGSLSFSRQDRRGGEGGREKSRPFKRV